jgi:hypothetical protein
MVSGLPLVGITQNGAFFELGQCSSRGAICRLNKVMRFAYRITKNTNTFVVLNNLCSSTAKVVLLKRLIGRCLSCLRVSAVKVGTNYAYQQTVSAVNGSGRPHFSLSCQGNISVYITVPRVAEHNCSFY